MEKRSLSFLMFLPLTLTVLTGCEGTNNLTDEKHEHQYSETWSSNETSHWHSATCEHTDLKTDVGTHTFGIDGVCSTCGYINSSSENKYEVNEDAWYSLLKGEGPFKIIKNGTINVERLEGSYTENFNLKFDDTIVKITGNSESYAQYNDEKYYRFDLYQSPDIYIRKEVNYSYLSELELLLDVLRSLSYNNFKYDDESHKYNALITVRTNYNNFDEVSIKFLNNKIMGIDCKDTLNNYTFKISFDYESFTLELPSYFDENSLVKFWSCYGGVYTNVLNKECEDIADKLMMYVDHTSKGSYKSMKQAVLMAIASCGYPNVGAGNIGDVFEYQTHFIIEQLDSYLTEDDVQDYDTNLMSVCSNVDQEGNKHLIALPYLETKEFLVYNIAFVEYCRLQNSILGTIPDTWQKWEEYGPLYRAIYDDLIDNQYCIYGRQAVNGSVSDLVAKPKENLKDQDDNYIDSEGRLALVDFTGLSKNNTNLMVWDQQDNAFITLIKQWGADYVEIPESEYQNDYLSRKAYVKFLNEESMPKTISCLKFFNKLNKKNIFGVPQEDYAERDIKANMAMFAVCASSQSSYLATNSSKLGIAPIPYYDDGVSVNKYLVSGGSSLFVTDRGNLESSFKFARTLSSGSNQATMCLNTGYFPTTKSARETNEYNDFLNETNPENIQVLANSKGISYADAEKEVYSNKGRNMNRETAFVNINEYNNRIKPWKIVNSDSFICSDILRYAVKDTFKYVFVSDEDIDNDKMYIKELNKIRDSVRQYSNIKFQ